MLKIQNFKNNSFFFCWNCFWDFLKAERQRFKKINSYFCRINFGVLGVSLTSDFVYTCIYKIYACNSVILPRKSTLLFSPAKEEICGLCKLKNSQLAPSLFVKSISVFLSNLIISIFSCYSKNLNFWWKFFKGGEWLE